MSIFKLESSFYNFIVTKALNVKICDIKRSISFSYVKNKIKWFRIMPKKKYANGVWTSIREIAYKINKIFADKIESGVCSSRREDYLVSFEILSRAHWRTPTLVQDQFRMTPWSPRSLPIPPVRRRDSLCWETSRPCRDPGRQ